jgi:hypothetical protein
LEVIKQNIFNIPGIRSKSKTVIFESDDWGSVRMPTRRVFDYLVKNGLRSNLSKFDSIDTLEKRVDIDALLNTLVLFSDGKGNHPRFTVNMVMSNPDFTAINNSDFLRYERQHFFDSYKYYYGELNEDIWNDAIRGGVFKPQFHAREHLNVELWMRDLRSGLEQTRKAFDFEFYGLKTITSSSLQKNYLSAYNPESLKELGILYSTISEGLYEFESTFGFKSDSFIACNYTWPQEIERHLGNHGISLLQGQRAQYMPIIKEGRQRIVYHYCGQVNSYNQRYLVRNVIFEPYLDQDYDWVSHAMNQITNAFFWRKPAIISTHRINYVSNLNIDNRDRTLGKLKSLLTAILRKWPDVEFKSTNQLIGSIRT